MDDGEKLREEQLIEDEYQIIQQSEDLVPQMNVNVPANVENTKEDIIESEKLLSMYEEVVQNIRDDRKQIADYIETFAEMVINGGDGTSSSKEALVNLIKAKSDMADKMAKIADLMTRVKLKERDTFPRYLAAKQENVFNVESSSLDKRKISGIINKVKKKMAQKDKE